MIENHFITTALELEGYRITRHCGVVRGIVVRSRSAIGNFAAGIQTFFGGNISLYTELCEQARQEAFDLMRQHAFEAGGNAIIGMRYDANDVAAGVTEVLAYGTAVVLELREQPAQAS
ncbi:MAG: YbjQ family protein [Planctomycetota bacterium]